MIVIGYPGIGKSSNSGPRTRFVDLDSFEFRKIMNCSDWTERYVDAAFMLDKQGFGVFTSSHEDVVNRIGSVCGLYCSRADVLVVRPDLTWDMEKVWKERMKERYEAVPSVKNLAAMKRVESSFDEDVLFLKRACASYGFTDVVIRSASYDLMDLIANCRDWNPVPFNFQC